MQSVAPRERGLEAQMVVSTGDIIVQGGRKLDLRDRSLSSEEVAALARLISTSTRAKVLSLYNVKLGSDVRHTGIYFDTAAAYQSLFGSAAPKALLG